VLQAADGEEAIGIARTNAEQIHLLVTDVVMPRMQGPEVALNVRADRPRIAVLYISGYSDPAVSQQTGFGHGSHYLQKP